MRGKAASTDKSILGKSELKNGKLGSPGPLAQPPKSKKPQCPECTSQKVWKDGLRYPRRFKSGVVSNPIQRYLCRSCGYRFSQPNVKLNIASKRLEGSKHIPDSGNIHAANFFPAKKRLNNPSLPVGENIGSQETSPSLILTTRKHLNTFYPNSKDCRVCNERNGSRKEHGSPVQMKHIGSGRAGVLQTTGAKNLVKVETRLKRAAGATKPDKATVKGKIIELTFWMKKQGYADEVAKNRTYNIKRLVDLGANLWDPESVKEVLAKQQWKNNYKRIIIYAYENFLQMEGLTWQRPKYKRQASLPFVPLENELDQLIISCGKILGTFLQGLKDTGTDPGELARLEWIDINKQSRTVSIKHPVKGHNPRILDVSNDFLNRLETLPKKSERVFNQTSLASNFYHQRKTVVRKLANPRIKSISLTTFRHWKATMEYHRTKDILYVMKLLGHKSLKNTMKYIDLEKAIYGSPGSEEFTVKVATNTEEVCELVKVGFEYVTGQYNDGGKIFRKRK